MDSVKLGIEAGSVAKRFKGHLQKPATGSRLVQFAFSLFRSSSLMVTAGKKTWVQSQLFQNILPSIHGSNEA